MPSHTNPHALPVELNQLAGSSLSNPKQIPSMILRIESRSVYGNTLYYPLGDPAKAIQKLTGKKTITPSDMAALEALGVHCQLIQSNVVTFIGHVSPNGTLHKL
jgi:hypothetical protein